MIEEKLRKQKNFQETAVAPTLKRAIYQGNTNTLQKRQLLAGIILLALPLFFYILFVVFNNYSVTQLNTLERFQGPSLNHWFGTDNYGRDVFARTLSGFPLTVIVSLGINLIGFLTGLIIGSLSGYLGGAVDYIFARFTESLLSIPTILMGLLFVASFGNGIWQVIVALGIMFIPSYARVIRSGFIEYRDRNFVKRLQLQDASACRIIFRHLLPLLKARILAALALGFANAILAESVLSFLGLGVPPSQITWGRMLKDAQGYIFQNASAAIFPGLMIVLMVLGSFMISNSFKHRVTETET